MSRFIAWGRIRIFRPNLIFFALINQKKHAFHILTRVGYLAPTSTYTYRYYYAVKNLDVKCTSLRLPYG